MRLIAIYWVCAIVAIGSSAAVDIPYVFEKDLFGTEDYALSKLDLNTSSDLQGQALVSMPNDADVIEFSSTGGSTSVANRSIGIGELRSIFDARVESNNSEVINQAALIAGPGDLTIDQICAIYNYLKNGTGSLKGWHYVRDPQGVDYYRYANETISLGKMANRSGVGDCDDFAILMSAYIEAIGGTTRILFAYGNTSDYSYGHSYAEVYLGRYGDKGSEIEDVVGWLMLTYGTDKIYAHVDPSSKDVWLNLDWGADSRGIFHPGGPFIEGDTVIPLIIRGDVAPPRRHAYIKVGNRFRKETIFGGPRLDEAYSVQQTSDGGYILSGLTNSYGAGYSDVWLFRANKKGMMLWNRTFGGAGGDWGNDVRQTRDGGYILVGFANASEDRITHSVVNDAWIIKTDENGNREWDRIFGGPAMDEGSSIRQTSDGGYIIVGTTESYGAGDTDAWLIKTNAEGHEEWNKTFGGYDADDSRSVIQTADGYVILGSTRSFGSGDWDLWLIKTDKTGEEEWNKTFGGPGAEEGGSVQPTRDGGYIATGQTSSYSAKKEMWLIKVDPTGTEKWNRTFSGPKMSEGRSVQQMADGGYILAGNLLSNMDDNNIWLIKTDPDGNKIWDKTFGSEGAADYCNSAQQTYDGGYVLAGYTESRGARGGDAWLIKTDAKGDEV